ncbi:MAG: hypothetical protein ACTTIJ_03690 [Dialister pneumosintes]
MPGDKISRVRAIRKWLEKAEKSFSSQKNLSGELNLIMARAEIQRLDEVHKWANTKKWCIRTGTFIIAITIFIDGSFFHKGINVTSDNIRKDNSEVESQFLVDTAKGISITTSSDIVKQENIDYADTQLPKSELNSVEASEIAINSQGYEESIENHMSIASEHMIESNSIMSAREIQSVVGEAGRALRGQ